MNNYNPELGLGGDERLSVRGSGTEDENQLLPTECRC